MLVGNLGGRVVDAKREALILFEAQDTIVKLLAQTFRSQRTALLNFRLLVCRLRLSMRVEPKVILVTLIYGLIRLRMFDSKAINWGNFKLRNFIFLTCSDEHFRVTHFA